MKKRLLTTALLIPTLAAYLLIGCRTTDSASASATASTTADEGETLPDYTPTQVSQVYPPSNLQAVVVPFAGGVSPSIADGSYMVIFGYQGIGPFNLPARAHSFGAFFKVKHDAQQRAILTNSFTISWLPVNGFISIVDQSERQGRNYGLRETIVNAQNDNRQIRNSRVQRVRDDFYDMVRASKTVHDQASQQNGIFYTVTPNMGQRQRALAWAQQMSGPSGADNCISALADVIYGPNDNLLDTGINHGFAASDQIFASFANWQLGGNFGVPDATVVQALMTAETSGDVALTGGSGPGPGPGNDDHPNNAVALCGNATANTQVCINAPRTVVTIRSLVANLSAQYQVQQSQPSQQLPGGIGYVGVANLSFVAGLGPATQVAFVVNAEQRRGRLSYWTTQGYVPWGGSGVFNLVNGN